MPDQQIKLNFLTCTPGPKSDGRHQSKGYETSFVVTTPPRISTSQQGGGRGTGYAPVSLIIEADDVEALSFSQALGDNTRDLTWEYAQNLMIKKALKPTKEAKFEGVRIEAVEEAGVTGDGKATHIIVISFTGCSGKVTAYDEKTGNITKSGDWKVDFLKNTTS